MSTTPTPTAWKVSCQTEGCTRQGAVVILDLRACDEDGQPIDGTAIPASCGSCGQPITNAASLPTDTQEP